MYIDRLRLARRTNREDFYETVSLFDDDTGAALKLDGCFVNGASAFTAAAWTVTDGAIATTSATSITIPVFPIGGTLSALALTVGAGLGILAGDPVKIADTATGLNYMLGYVVSYVAATGALVVQIGVTFQFEIRTGGPRNWNIDDFSPFFYVGQVLQTPPILSASLGNGITHIDTGVIQVRVAESSFRQLNRRTYQAALTMTDSIDTREIFVAELPVGYGGVTN